MCCCRRKCLVSLQRWLPRHQAWHRINQLLIFHPRCAGHSQEGELVVIWFHFVSSEQNIPFVMARFKAPSFITEFPRLQNWQFSRNLITFSARRMHRNIKNIFSPMLVSGCAKRFSLATGPGPQVPPRQASYLWITLFWIRFPDTLCNFPDMQQT